MSKAERLREMQTEINKLRDENRQLRGRLAEYYRRDRPMAGDFIKRENHESKPGY